MILSVSIINIWVLDQDRAKDFYANKLGFAEVTDVDSDGYRWLSVAQPDQPDLQLLLMRPGPPLSDANAAAVTRLLEDGALSPVVLDTADCRSAHAQLLDRGVVFTQEPQQRDYGLEAVMQDSCGNWIALIERSR